MKHINFANINLGMELSPSFHKQQQEALLERLSAMLKGLTNNAAGIVILDGCVMTKVGDQYDQTAGVVYYQGEILTVDVFSGNHATQIPVYQAATNTFTQQAWYGDGVKRDTFYTRKLPMVMAIGGSGIADYTAVTRIENIKANKEHNWTNLVFTNGWIAGSGFAPGFSIDGFGRVNLRGTVDGQNASAAQFANNLPQPGSVVSISTMKSLGSLAPLPINLIIGVTGLASFSTANFGNAPIVDIFNLDGLSYWID